MILAIDIGNTTTNFGVFARPPGPPRTKAGAGGNSERRSGERGRLVSQCSIATQPGRAPDEVTLELKALAKSRRLHLGRAKQILICSVVPRMSSVLVQALRLLGTGPVRVVGQDLQVPLKNRYTYPEQVGQDRLVGAYAAWRMFGDPDRRPERAPRQRGESKGGRDVIVCDFGTAITIDLVTKSGEYLGGVIAPGLDISLEALATRTALLPKVELREPPELLGRDTANSIRSGLLYGCAALCDGLVAQMKRQYAPTSVVVATGGASALIAKYAHTIDRLTPHLVLDGLYQLSLPTTSIRPKVVQVK